jgi:hypothetical protein
MSQNRGVPMSPKTIDFGELQLARFLAERFKLDGTCGCHSTRWRKSWRPRLTPDRGHSSLIPTCQDSLDTHLRDVRKPPDSEDHVCPEPAYIASFKSARHPFSNCHTKVRSE